MITGKTEKINLPPKMYKFQAVNEQSLDNLENGVIWFSNPRVFNDPFELRIIFDKDNISDSDLNIFIGQIRELGMKQKKVFTQEDIDYVKTNRNEFLDKVENVFREKMNKLSTTTGLACFSANNNNILMWSHYSEKHTGFCLEYDTSSLPFNIAKPVSYQSTFPKVNDITKLLT